MDGCKLLLHVHAGPSSSLGQLSHRRQRAGSRAGLGTAASGRETLLEAIRG